jgi:hypothetical protein
MNKKEVSEVTNFFVNHIKNDVIKALEETPMDISLFDPDGSQQSAFKDIIKKLVEMCKDLVEKISSKVETCVGEDIDRVQLSARQSAETLRRH